MSRWGLFGQAFSIQSGISLAGNAASKPHLSNKFLALEGKLAPTAIQSLPPFPGARSGPRGVGRKAPTGCTGPWGRKRAGAPLSSSPVWPIALFLRSQPRTTGISVTHPCFRTGLGQGLARAMETSAWVCSRQGWVQIWSRLVLRRARQTNWGGNHLLAAGWQLILQGGRWGVGRSTCASYTEKGCLKSCPWRSPSQGCFPVLNGVSKFLLLRDKGLLVLQRLIGAFTRGTLG